MQQFRGLLLNRRDDARMAMPRGADGDPRREVEVQVAVHVFDHRPVAALDRQRIRPRVRRRDEPFVGLDQLARNRPGGRSADMGNVGERVDMVAHPAVNGGAVILVAGIITVRAEMRNAELARWTVQS